MQKYSVNQYTIENIVNWVKSGEIAIPEIQRPFVWDSTKVRDLMDSLYQGYPVGYIISQLIAVTVKYELLVNVNGQSPEARHATIAHETCSSLLRPSW